jgi:glucosamine 6-phosphate synthetase-like amidotransferase/phosphosugar isomerase protein
MCGIAGYNLSARSTVRRTLSAQALLAGIAERGADAVGYAFRQPTEAAVVVHKQQSGASDVLDHIRVPAEATQLLLHVRDYTKGHPSIAANNHPVRHGRVIGIHNGIIVNDDELLAGHACARAEDGMSVDSEAIFALAAHAESDATAFEQLRGTMAAAWLDERLPDVLFLARGFGRPLWIGRGKREVFFASTRTALEVAEHFSGLKLRKSEVSEGRLLAIRHGRIERDERFAPDRSYVEPDPLPPVRAPHEGISCLRRLAALATG